MLKIEDAVKLDDLKLIDEEIQTRINLINSMVGNLYPHIVGEEVRKLNIRYSEIYRICKRNKIFMNENHPDRS